MPSYIAGQFCLSSLNDFARDSNLASTAFLCQITSTLEPGSQLAVRIEMKKTRASFLSSTVMANTSEPQPIYESHM